MRHCCGHTLGKNLMGAAGSGTDKTQHLFYFVLRPLSGMSQHPMTGLSTFLLGGVRDSLSGPLRL